MKDMSGVLFITDMDGTLLKDDKTIDSKDAEAFDRFRAAGGSFALATGRSLQSAERYFSELKISGPVIICNGGGIYDCSQKKFVWEKFVDTSLTGVVRNVYENFPQVGIEIDLSDRIVVPRMTPAERIHIDISYSYSGAIPVLETDIDSALSGGWCKVLFAAEENDVPQLMDFVYSLKNDKADYVRSSRNYFEILPKGCTKGKTLNVLRGLYPDIKKIAAFGDYDNDLEMIENADVALAPANAQECVKAAADYVTEADNNSAAAAEAINYVMNVL